MMMLSARQALRTAGRIFRVPVAAAARSVVTNSKAGTTAASAWKRGLIVTAGVTFGVVALNSETAHALSGKVDWEGSVRKDIVKLIEDEEERRGDGTGIGPTLIRLAWHASGTYDCKAKNGGSNGATMRFCPEGNWGANQGLCIARRMLEPIQAKYGCSFADLWTFAGKVAVEEAGGPMIPWRAGRSDADDGSKIVPDGRLPDATQGAAHLRDVFYRMGFNDKDIVALSGAHSMGFCHLDNSGFVGPWSFAPNSFSNEYFRLLVDEKWVPKTMHRGKPWKGPLQYQDSTGKLMMLPTDLALMEDPEFKKHVIAYKEDEELFFKDFAAAFGKLMELGCPFPNAGGAAGGAGIIGEVKRMFGLTA